MIGDIFKHNHNHNHNLIIIIILIIINSTTSNNICRHNTPRPTIQPPIYYAYIQPQPAIQNPVQFHPETRPTVQTAQFSSPPNQIVGYQQSYAYIPAVQPCNTQYMHSTAPIYANPQYTGSINYNYSNPLRPPIPFYTQYQPQYSSEAYWHSAPVANQIQGQENRPYQPEIKCISTILDMPGRTSRPPYMVIIVRGIPGSGKSVIAKLIKEKEILHGESSPRILSIDDYFMSETEQFEKCLKTGKRIRIQTTSYEYQSEMEEAYRNSLLKSFTKTLESNLYKFIIVDSYNHKICHFDNMFNQAINKGFQVFIAECKYDPETCFKRNTHNRTKDDIIKMASEWEDLPPYMIKLNLSALINQPIKMVEMEDVDNDNDSGSNQSLSSSNTNSLPTKSKWDLTSAENLDRLDGVTRFKSKEKDTKLIEEDGHYSPEFKQGNKKRVRWVDIETAYEDEKRQKIGFFIGKEWTKPSDLEAENILLGKISAKESIISNLDNTI